MSVDDKEILGRVPDNGDWFYMRREGYPMRSGFGIMWDSISRGFLLKIGPWFVWCRWSMRAKKLFFQCGKHTREEFGTEIIFPDEPKRFMGRDVT